MSHTPGPWQWDPPDEEIHYGMIIHEHDLGTIDIAIVEPGPLGDETQWEANATLIAAAPELLEALDALLRHHQTAAFAAHDIPDRGPEARRAHTAIAKARGEA